MQADPGALVASLLYYWVPPTRCVIKGVAKLPSGSWAEFLPDGRHTIRRYWAIEEVAAEAAAGPPIELQPVIEESVAAHLVADVPVSSFLSGGLDSSIVSVLAKRINPELDAYTITFRPQDHRLEAMPDDAKYARKVATQFGIELHEIKHRPTSSNSCPEIIDVLDEPVGDPAAINTLLMCQAARQAGVKVVLSGMGADELFGGYRKHLACQMASTYRRVPRPARRAVRATAEMLPVVAAGRGLRHVRWGKRFLEFAELPEAQGFRRSYTLYDPSELVDLVSPELGKSVDDVLDEHDAVYADSVLADPVNRMRLTDSRLFLPGSTSPSTDRASMAASVEVRVPFVDPTVVAAAFSLPGSAKVRGRTTKVALKQAAAPGCRPRSLTGPSCSFQRPPAVLDLP